MKSIALKKEKERVFAGQEGFVNMEISTISLLNMCLNANIAQSGGFSISEIRQRLKILDKIEALKKEATTFELEDAEFDLLKSIVQTMDERKLFTVISKFLLAFIDEILDKK